MVLGATFHLAEEVLVALAEAALAAVEQEEIGSFNY
jgi:hypothetical protein